MQFSNRTVIITGAAGNLGKAVARAFADQGARRVLVDLGRDSLEKAFGSETDQQAFAAANLLDMAGATTVAQAALARFGRIDVLCNIAGGFRMGEGRARDLGRQLELPVRHQCANGAACSAGRSAAHDCCGRRQDRQHRRIRRTKGRRADGRVYSVQRHRDPHDRGHGWRTTRQTHQRELRAADHHRHHPRIAPRCPMPTRRNGWRPRTWPVSSRFCIRCGSCRARRGGSGHRAQLKMENRAPDIASPRCR